MAMKKIFCILLALVMIAAAFAGCAGGGKQSDGSKPESSAASKADSSGEDSPNTDSDVPEYLNTESDFPIVKDGYDVTLRAVISQQDGFGSDDPNDYWFIAWAQQKMNIKLDVELIAGSALDEKKPLLFASQTLPDLLWCLSLSSTDMVTYGQNGGLLLDLKPYINEHNTPHILQWFDAFPEAEQIVTCLNGAVYTLPGIGDASDIGDFASRSFVNKKWLDDNGMKMPETIDEYTEMLRAYKEANPDLIPLGGSYENDNPGVVLLSGLGFITTDPLGVSPALRNGEAVIPAANADYREYLSTMKTYYDEGLIARDFFTMDSTETQALAAEKQHVAMATVPYLVLPEAEDFKEYVSTNPLTSDMNSEKVWPVASRYSIGQLSVAANCKYPEVAVRFADFFFSDMGHIYKWSGPMEGSEDTLGMVDGWFVEQNDDGSYTFDVRDVRDGKYDNRWVYYISAIIPSGGILGIGNCTISMFEDQDTGYLDNCKFAGIEWKRPLSLDDGDQNFRATQLEYQAPYAHEGYPSILYFTEEQNARLSDLKTVIDAYIKTETARFITGVRPLDDFDTYLNELETLGLSEYLGFYTDYYAQLK